MFGWSSVDKRLDYLTDATRRTRNVYDPELVRKDGSVNNQETEESSVSTKLKRSVFGTIMPSPDRVPDGAIGFHLSPNERHDDQFDA